MLPAFQSLEQIQGVYGDKVAADIERNCAVRLVLRPAGLAEAKKISDQLGSYTFRARSRSMGTWGGGGGSTSDSDQRRSLMLPQEVELLPENDLIVFRRGMYATYGRKARYYAEKKLAERTKIPAPEMPPIRIDLAIAANSLRVIEASATSGEANTAPPTFALASGPGNETAAGNFKRSVIPFNQSAVDAAKAAPVQRRTSILFNRLLVVKQSDAA
jgi:type IV secretion system protein VirD4